MTNSQDDNQVFQKADAYFRAGRYDDALKLLDGLSRRYPDTKNVLYPPTF